ncbi:hypothetical protein L1276_004064 [Flavobacterium sp. HSC-32F16]|nr:DUF5958 family protein [Flavobacterium sp. HSC-32F16]MCP2028893.1 hypothetical protein [Flavobacterium sp. HSC-32F16]
MNPQEQLINKIAQNKIDFELGLKLLLDNDQYNFQTLFTALNNYIINAIPNKTDYYSETYQTAINTIPLKSTFTSIVLLKTFRTKIAFAKLVLLPESENKKQ